MEAKTPSTPRGTRGSGAGDTTSTRIPALPFYPKFVRLLAEKGLSRERLDEMTHDAICRIFGITISLSRRTSEFDLAGEYEFDPFSFAG